MGIRDVRGALKRRGVLAGVGALVAAGLAKLGTPERAAAGHNTNIAYNSQTTMHLDVTNTTAGSTRISSNISGTAAFVGLNNYPVGISRPDGILGRTTYTTSNCAGVAGTCEAASGGNGVMGAAKASNGVGVYGYAGSVVPSTLGPAGTGVYGFGPSFGTYGGSTNGIGAQGSSVASEGVHGNSSTGMGVVGLSVSNYGVFGYSQNTNAIVGQADGAGASVAGFTRNGIGVYGGVAAGAAGYAGQFDGPLVAASLTVTGAKSAAVRLPDGSHRRMHCMEAPEAWFEDGGEAKLSEGKSDVKLDGDFAAVVQTDRYFVFLTEVGASSGLYVSSQSSEQFAVRSKDPSATGGSFYYRVMAKRKDIPGTRLEKVNLPKPIEFREPKRTRYEPDTTPPPPSRGDPNLDD